MIPTNISNEPRSFAGVCKDFFGYRQGTGLGEFGAELKELTDQDKAEMKAEFTKMGYVFKA